MSFSRSNDEIITVEHPSRTRDRYGFAPAALLYVSVVYFGMNVAFSENIMVLAASIAFFVIGFLLVITTTRLFFRVGKGTPAPWNPPTTLVVKGPYRYMRNPMNTGVMFLVLGEALLFWSLALGAWASLFFVANMLYFPFVEEKQLLKRYGKEYEEYTKNVPRWIPRLTPWEKR
jgi:protein-S-isoprenylcysteine O-methyltransferase Ste14